MTLQLVPFERARDLAATHSRILSARARLAPYLRATPAILSHTFSKTAEREVVLKLENLQRTGSFKIRGALNKILSLPEAAREQGLVAASAGNHAQGVALAAQQLGVPATVVMPTATAMIKVRRTEQYGARVVLFGRNWNEAQAKALELEAEHGWTAVHPFDDYDVIEGQGTLGLELVDEVEGLEAVVVPVGGGGLLAGVAAAIKHEHPDIRVYGIQAEGADPMVRSFHSGTPETVASPTTIAEGIRVGTVGRHTFPMIRELVDDMITVSDEDITDAIIVTMERISIVAETAAVVGIAALAADRIPGSGRVCAVISGGNIDLSSLGRLIETGLTRAGFYRPVRVRIEDLPGALRAVLDVFAEGKTNVLDVWHHRTGWRIPIGFVDVEILAETKTVRQGDEIVALLRAKGYEVFEST